MIPKPEAATLSFPAIEITRRSFVKAGGALFISMTMLPRASAAATDSPPPTASTPIAAWIELRSDNTVLVRTGRIEIGTGMSGFYTQVVAEELNIRPEAITLIKTRTRQLAKRQMTWFRREPGLEWLTVAADESPTETAAKILEKLPSH